MQRNAWPVKTVLILDVAQLYVQFTVVAAEFESALYRHFLRIMQSLTFLAFIVEMEYVFRDLFEFELCVFRNI